MPQHPNFLVFCVDQMQSYCLGCNGHPVVQTPNIDALAARGVNFPRGYCNNSVCMPSRASMITGKTPRQHGLLTNGNSLSPDVPTVTQALADAGYRTHGVGKFHLQPNGGCRGKLLPLSDSVEGQARWQRGELTSLPRPYYGFQTTDFLKEHRNWLKEHHPEAVGHLRETYYSCGGETGRLTIPEELHENHWIADRSIDFLRRQADNTPFFLFCSFLDPHHPFMACRPYSEMYDPAALALPATYCNREDGCSFLDASRVNIPDNQAPEEAELREILAQTYGMITHVDANIGRVMAALERSVLAENTIVLFIADHGEYLGGHGLIKKMVWPYEELWRIPFIAAGPGVQSGVCSTPVSLLDLTPTFLDYAGLDPLALDTRGPAPAERLPLPGESLRPFLEGRLDAPHRPLVMEYDEDFHEKAFCRLRGLIDGELKIVLYGGFDDGVLFNLADDPHELRNLWNEPQAQGRKAELLAHLVQRLAQTDRFDSRRYCGA